MLPRLEPRGGVSAAMMVLTPLIAVGVTLIAGVILFAALGFDPGLALYTFFVKPVSSVYGVSELLLKATPLAIIAIGLAFGFRANVWNIGAEGQFTLGAICGGGVALALHGVDSWLVLPAMALAGIVGGLAWAAVPAFLRVRFNANEILTSLMLTYVATLFLSYLVHGPWRDPEGLNFPESRMFEDPALLPVILDETRLSIAAPDRAPDRPRRLAGVEPRLRRLPDQGGRAVAGGGELCRILGEEADLDGALRLGRARRARRHVRGVRSDRPAPPRHLAGLRLHRDHRRFSRAAASRRGFCSPRC